MFMKTCFIKSLLTKSFDLPFKKCFSTLQVQIVDLRVLNILLQGQLSFSLYKNIVLFQNSYVII